MPLMLFAIRRCRHDFYVCAMLFLLRHRHASRHYYDAAAVVAITPIAIPRHFKRVFIDAAMRQGRDGAATQRCCRAACHADTLLCCRMHYRCDVERYCLFDAITMPPCRHTIAAINAAAIALFLLTSCCRVTALTRVSMFVSPC